MATYNSHNTKQWNDLISAINGGDTSAIATALTAIKTSIDSINTSLSSLSIDVEQDSAQWTNLITAITNQSLNVDLSNITSSVVNNLSNVSGSTTTEAFNVLNSTLDNLYAIGTSGTKSGKGLSVQYITYGKIAVIRCINALKTNVAAHETIVTGLPIPALSSEIYITCEAGVAVYLTPNGELKSLNARNQGNWITFTYMYLTQ